MTSKTILRNFLSEGFFAAQIPPCFSSKDFSNKVNKASPHWDLIKKGRCIEEAAYEKYSVARVGHNRRPIAITNPIAQYYLTLCIADAWPIINKFFKGSKISLSTPKLSKTPGRAISITPIKQLQEERLLRSSGSRYSLISDISQFFPSIYTHSISWAIEGKEKAKGKAVRNDKLLLSNRLDELCRYTQQNQTIGIPIGPDTSHVISEIVAVALDKIIKEKLGYWPLGFRHVDDFCLYFDNEYEASKALSILIEVLSIYELKPNIQKTKILKLSEISSESWIHNFDSFEFSQNKLTQRRDLHRFFDLAFSLAQRFDDENVMQYALRRVETEIIKSKNWDIFSAYLMRCMDAFPNTIPECSTIIDTYHKYLRPIDFPLKIWQKFISSQIIQHSPLEKHSEVAWLLWLALRLNIAIDKKAVILLEQIKSSICLCICLELEKRGLLRKALARKKLPEFIDEVNLFGPFWLLMYESAAQNWLPTAVPSVEKNRYFKELLNLEVKFFNPEIAPPPIFSLKNKNEHNPSAVTELLDSDEDLYDLFEFLDVDKDYLGRRARKNDDDDDDVDDEDPWI